MVANTLTVGPGYWDDRARHDSGLHAVMTKRWTRDECAVVDRQMRAAITDAVRASHADPTIWLDLGCGTGRFLNLPFTIGAPVTGVLGVDSSHEMCRRAARAHADNPRVRVVQATGSALPVADATVTAGLIVAVLQHLDATTLRRTAAEVSRVLAPGGTVVMVEGTRESLGGAAPAGTTATSFYRIDDFQAAFGSGLSLTLRVPVTFIEDRYTCLVWKRLP